ncbi:MAG: hypothetical protein M4D80_02845 [Myxococcota bacterium]|nr:hypothetical protein [Myxococcota bacterium]
MRLIHVVLLGCGLAACGTDSESDTPDDPVARATWYQDVAPILANRCMTCHQDGGIAPFTLTEYETAVESSARMVHEIDRGAMPPFDAREEADCTPRFGWVDDPRLTTLEKDKLRMWIEDGHALGKEAQIPAVPDTTLANISKTVAPSTPWTTSGTRDQFICFVLDPQATKLEWLTGLQVRPDNELVVHHAVITSLLPTNAQHDAVVAQRGIGKPWDCGEAAQPGDFTVHVWTPGNQPMQTQGDIAVPIVAGSKLVMQIHYHPAGLTNAPDATAVDLRYSTTWPQRMYFVAALGNSVQAPELLLGEADLGTPRFLIPAMAADHDEHMRITIPAGFPPDVRLFSANPHMHLVGTHISATIERPSARGSDPKNECLANGAWNFDWQRTYQYNAPLDKLPSVMPGDVVDIKCKWDNSLANPFVQRMMKDAGLSAPIDVTLGEQTTNEMCLEIFGLSLPAPAQTPGATAMTVDMPDMGGLVVR